MFLQKYLFLMTNTALLKGWLLLALILLSLQQVWLAVHTVTEHQRTVGRSRYGLKISNFQI